MRSLLAFTTVIVTVLFLLLTHPTVTNGFSIRSKYLRNNILVYNHQKITNIFINRKSSALGKPLYFKVSESDELTEVEQEEVEFDSVDKSDILLKLSRGLIPVAASVGFAVTPSPVIAARIAGAAVGGVAGLITRNVIASRIKPVYDDDDDNDGNGSGGHRMSTAVTTALVKLMTGPPAISSTLSDIEKIAKQCKVQNDELSELFTYLFAEIVYKAVQPDSMDLTELGEVVDFAVNVGLSPSEIGDGFALAALKVGRKLKKDKRGFFQTEKADKILHQAAKMFFLADKMIGSSEGFYGKRMSVGLCFFTLEEYKVIISDACTKLFRRCVESVLANPDVFTVEEVDQLKEFLSTSADVSSLRPANMQNMILETIQKNLDQSLSAKAMDAQFKDYEKFDKAKEILGWNTRELDATIETRTMPLFESAASEIVNTVFDKPESVDEMREVLEERIASLNIDIRKARVFLTKLISTKNGEYMSQIDKVYTVSGAIEPAFKIMISYAKTHEAFKKLTDKIMEGMELPVPGLPFADMVRLTMYQMQLEKGEESISDAMFELTPFQKEIVRKNLALPKVTTWINQCITENNFDDGAKNAYMKLLTNYGIGTTEWKATAVDFYYQEVDRIAKSKQVPTADDMERLDKLKTFLDCDANSVAKVNLELFGDKYVKAIVESMSPTGVISEEYVDGLNRLANRLGLSKADREDLLSYTTRKRIDPIVKGLIDVWKSDTDANYRRDKEKKDKDTNKARDKSSDPIDSPDNIFGYMELGAQKEGGGPNVYMREALNLVDFVVENYQSQGVDLRNPANVPVTAVGIAPESELAGMFKHYLITRLSEQDPNLRARYIADEPVFANILGIPAESQVKIKESLAYTAYKNMLKNVLAYKDVATVQDIQQFAVLKDSLKLSQESADKIFDESTRAAVVEHAASIFRVDERVITADMARRFREQVLFQILLFDCCNLFCH